MATTKNNSSIFKAVAFKHILFWFCVFMYFMFSSNIINFPEGYLQLFYSTSKIVIPQILTAYICLFILVPKFLNKKKLVPFILWLLVVLVLGYMLYLSMHMFWYEPKYYKYFSESAKLYAEKNFWERFTNFSVLLSKSIKFLTPTVILLLSRFYKNQQKYLKLNEQKKTAELTALKHQLNPHFLFNTLNNLYALALKKDDKTPEVIEKLSNILDYMLYRTNDTFVSLQKEIELIENYLSLEKIRYGNRVNISFEKDIKQNEKIAPLLLLTFIENAFKHGVTQELETATIDINIASEGNQIAFSIKNSKPKAAPQTKNGQCIGLENVKKQLELIYPNQYNLTINNSKNEYIIDLKLATK